MDNTAAKHGVINIAACFDYLPSESGRICGNTCSAVFRTDGRCAPRARAATGPEPGQ